MLLASHGQFAFKMVRASREFTLCVAACNTHRCGEKAAGGDRVCNRENRGQRPILSDYAARAQPCGFECLAQHPGYRLLMEHDLCRKDRLIVARRTCIAFAGNVGRCQD